MPDTALAEAEERYRALFASDMMGIALSDLDDRILEANDAFLRIIGYSREDLELGRLAWSAITPAEDFVGLDRKKLREIARRGTLAPFEKRYVRKDGSEVPVLVGATTIRNDPPLSVCFALDISEQKRLERKKDEFASTVSHELQTPLAVLKMQVGLVRDRLHEGAPAAELERGLDEIEEQTSRLSVLITDLLNLARYAGEEGVPRTVFDLAACAAKVAEDARLLTRRRITLVGARKSCHALGRERQVAQALTNLLTNALRYSAADTTVTILVSATDKEARVAVRDAGLGIAPEELPKIFGRLYRAEHVRSRGGSGIGLYVANKVMRANGGSIEVASTPGKGSTFTLVLARPKG